MLYDILIIDDDFSGETVLDKMETEAKKTSNSAAWEQTIMPFYFGLIRENLKVIWSTGETDDLEKLDQCQLSKVKYIICDLHLLGIDTNATNKTIISKIMGILEKLKDNLGDKIFFLVNSKYIDNHENITNDLQIASDKKYPQKYSVSVFSKKNAITSAQKQELLNTSLLSHIKEQIIVKHLKVERCFNQKIDTKDDEVLKELSFNSKHKIVKNSHNLNGDNTKIQKLNESRNAIAHNQINSLGELAGIKNIDSDTQNIKSFLDLFNHLKKIDTLIKNITNANTKAIN